MIQLILGLVVFFGMHIVRVVAPGFRNAQVAANEGQWKVIYSIVSTIGFVLIVWGYAIWRAEAPQLYVPADWGRWAALPLDWFGLILIVAAYQPVGTIKANLQHPMLIGTAMWAGGHLLANGDGAGVLLFGSFLVYSLVDLVSQFTRRQPLATFETYRGDTISVIAGTVVTAALAFGVHGWLFGANPLG